MKLLKKIVFFVVIGMFVVFPVLALIGSGAASAVKISDFLDGSARDIYVSGTTAYVSTGSGGLKIYDISTLSAPVKIGEIDDIGYVESAFISGSYAYLAAGESGLLTVDISTPTNPLFLDSFSDLGMDEYATQVVVMGNIAYLADNEDGLEVLNVMNRSRIRIYGDYDMIGTDFDALEVVGNRVFAVGKNGLVVIDVSNVYSPTAIVSFKDGGMNTDIEIVGEYAFLADSVEGLEILNISNLANITQLGQYDLPFKSLDSVSVSGSYAYVSSHNGFEIINITDVTNPTKVGGIDNGRGLGIAIDGDYAFACEFERGVAIYNISNPANPTEYARIDDEVMIRDIAITGNSAYIAVGEEGVMRIDLTTSSTPQLDTANDEAPIFNLDANANNLYGVSNLSMKIFDSEISVLNTYPSTPIDVVVSGSRLYIFKVDGIDVVDITNPSSPSSIENYTHHEFGGLSTGFVDSSYVYAVDPDYGVYLLSIENVATVVGLMEFYFVKNCVVQGKWAYLLSNEFGLGIFDLSDPTDPILVGEYHSVFDAPYKGLAVKDNVAYIGNQNGIVIVDVSDPENPTELFQYDDDPVTCVQLMGEYVVYCSVEDGIEIMHPTVSLDRTTIPGFSPLILIVTLVGASAILIIRKYKK